MYGQGKKKNPRSTVLIMDWIHICIGLLVVILAVFAFLNPEQNRFLFPVIFLLAAVLNVINGIYRFRLSGREKKKKLAAIMQLILAAVLVAVMAVSAITIWR